MEHFFDLPVFFEDTELKFKCRMVTFGYTYKFYVIVDKHEIVFERDEEMNFRAINVVPENSITPNKGILQAIVTSLKMIDEKP